MEHQSRRKLRKNYILRVVSGRDSVEVFQNRTDNWSIPHSLWFMNNHRRHLSNHRVKSFGSPADCVPSDRRIQFSHMWNTRSNSHTHTQANTHTCNNHNHSNHNNNGTRKVCTTLGCITLSAQDLLLAQKRRHFPNAHTTPKHALTHKMDSKPPPKHLLHLTSPVNIFCISIRISGFCLTNARRVVRFWALWDAPWESQREREKRSIFVFRPNGKFAFSEHKMH